MGIIMSSQKIKDAIETIRIWLKNIKNYPENFKDFFFNWTLLNVLYNAVSNYDPEYQRVLELGKFYDNLWDDNFNELARTLIKLECVGKGRDENPPSPYVKQATIQLRNDLGLPNLNLCSNCRNYKRIRCQSVVPDTHNFKKLEALIRIIYQIRCNLFHGEKLEDYEPQISRNNTLINLGNKILGHIFNKII